MIIKFLYVAMRNFMSYGNNVTTVHFDHAGTTLITGEDLDNTVNGRSANGVGKTTILNALTYTLYDKPISKINVDKLINNVNKKHMQTTVEFIAANGNHYKVVRERKMKAGAAGNGVYLFENGKDVSVDAAGTNRLIERALGIPYHVFVRMVVFSAGHLPFLDLPHRSTTGPNQTDFIEELLGLTELTAKADRLKDAIKTTKLNLDIKQSAVKQLEREHAQYENLVTTTKSRIQQWTVNNKTTIARLKAELQKASGIDVEAEKVIHDRVAALKSQLQEVEAEKRRLSSSMTVLSRDYRTATNECDHLRDNNCPFCKQGMPDAASRLVAVNEKAEDLAVQISSLSVEIDALTRRIEDFEGELEQLLPEMKCANLAEIIEINKSTASIQSQIATLESSANPHEEVLQELLANPLDPIDYTEVNEASKVLIHQQFLLKLLTKDDSFVRKKLLSKNIPFLNERLQQHLSELGLPHKVEFKYDMSAEISRFGQPLDFGSLSAGQQARVNFALSLAFKETKQRLCSRINISLYDEVLDRGLDATGIQLAAKLIKKLAREEQTIVFIISHRDEIIGMFDRTLHVQMSKGFSNIVVQ